eukprot:CAMPEP_0197851934 /NCGR_PEP_ID=MMETSP1438-20131217/19260_1 /TAXON_ID=1461541 /ORGANISM="Pterosperma sp., Strain CCMP1384" /LENGTH=272 /DNA_ID=CAMNT_0043465739 /DNA_START=69 /DNA_END=884 /DNA_ORIENTATION=+
MPEESAAMITQGMPSKRKQELLSGELGSEKVDAIIRHMARQAASAHVVHVEKDIKERFEQCCKVLNVKDQQVKDKWQQIIIDNYSAKRRVYHTLKHIYDMFKLFDQYKHALENSNLVAVAILFHDLVYEGRNREDEEKSAQELRRFGAEVGMPSADIDEVARWIELTATHQVESNECKDCKFFMDFDMAVLGLPWLQYREYFLNVKKEYQGLKSGGWLFSLFWAFGRPKAMGKLLQVEHIYATPAFRERYEARARDNLAKEMNIWWWTKTLW